MNNLGDIALWVLMSRHEAEMILESKSFSEKERKNAEHVLNYCRDVEIWLLQQYYIKLMQRQWRHRDMLSGYQRWKFDMYKRDFISWKDRKWRMK